jgi:hypothetical protein
MPATASDGLFKGLLGKLRAAAGRLQASQPIDDATRRYIEFNQRKWKPDYPRREESVVLVGEFEHNPSIHCYSYITNYLARKTGSVIETFTFYPRRDARLEKLYVSFGAKPGLTMAGARRFMEAATRKANEIFGTLQNKWDVLNIAVDGVILGDLIYDSYLRYFVKATVDLRDEKLLEIIRDALMIFYECRDYLASHKVVAVIPDHTVYINCGILIRLASLAKIPVFMVMHKRAFVLIRLDPRLPEGNQSNERRWPYPEYKQIFKQLAHEQRCVGRAKGGEALAERLSGKIDDRVLNGISAYAPAAETRVFETDDTPRVLVLLNDFCDNVHKFRHMLFADYYDWAHFIFERASQTPFSWYAKPHPNNLLAQQKNALNNSVIAELNQKYPRIKILDPSVSNRQMVAEGISAVFTAHGTAGHEFAYMGVPVVNSGDNLHISYSFNLHPKTVEELEQCIRRADSLGVTIDKAEVEEFFYMHNFHFIETNQADVNPIPEEFRHGKQSVSPAAFGAFIESASPGIEEKLNAYFEKAFAGLTS